MTLSNHGGTPACRNRGWAAAGCCALGPLLLMAGCESSPEPKTSGGVTDRQDAAMKDPFSYGPAEHSGKKPVEEPKKRDDSLKGDWDRFWNP